MTIRYLRNKHTYNGKDYAKGTPVDRLPADAVGWLATNAMLTTEKPKAVRRSRLDDSGVEVLKGKVESKPKPKPKAKAKTKAKTK